MATLPEDPVRPRYGMLHHADGTQTLLVFHPSPDDPTVFQPLDAGTRKPVAVRADDLLRIDALGAGQAVALIRAG